MRRRNLLTAIASGAILATTLAGTVGAAANPFLFPFHDCVGPSGTPTSFTAEKMEVPFIFPGLYFAHPVAYRLTDGSAVFIALIRDDLFNPPGIAETSVATTTCLVDTPLGTLTFSGFLTPTH